MKLGAEKDIRAMRNCGWLTTQELQRNTRFRFDNDRARDLMARWLTRNVLAEYTEQTPQALIIERSEKGKPYLATLPKTLSADALHFNLSHTGDWVVMAIAKHCVGVDIEMTERKNDVLAIANNYFFGAELEELRSFPVNQQVQRFFDYWTLKEAYMKARGEGISLGLDNFGFQLANNTINLQVKPKLKDDPSRWQFACQTPAPNYRLALAHQNQQPFNVIVERFWAGGERQQLAANNQYQWQP